MEHWTDKSITMEQFMSDNETFLVQLKLHAGVQKEKRNSTNSRTARMESKLGLASSTLVTGEETETSD